MIGTECHRCARLWIIIFLLFVYLRRTYIKWSQLLCALNYKIYMDLDFISSFQIHVVLLILLWLNVLNFPLLWWASLKKIFVFKLNELQTLSAQDTYFQLSCNKYWYWKCFEFVNQVKRYVWIFLQHKCCHIVTLKGLNFAEWNTQTYIVLTID